MAGEDIGAAAPGEAAYDPPMRTRLIGARLLRLLLLYRLSGALAYRHRTGFVESHRRLLTLVANYGGLTFGELVGLLGSEKAQVSRTLSLLTETGLVSRESRRARIALTAAGTAAFERILAVAVARNADLTAGIPLEDLGRFFAIVLALTERAITMLAREQETSPGVAEDTPPNPPMPTRLRLDDDGRPLARMVAPPLITLVAYLQRSAAIVYRREIGLSTFQWQVMSQIGEYAPVPLLRLVEIIARDKSQVGRTVARLEEMGLVARATTPGRGRMVVLDMTAEGRRVYGQMCAIAIEREACLFEMLSETERAGFVAELERLTANAERVLAEERAAETA